MRYTIHTRTRTRTHTHAQTDRKTDRHQHIRALFAAWSPEMKEPGPRSAASPARPIQRKKHTDIHTHAHTAQQACHQLARPPSTRTHTRTRTCTHTICTSTPEKCRCMSIICPTCTPASSCEHLDGLFSSSATTQKCHGKRKRRFAGQGVGSRSSGGCESS